MGEQSLASWWTITRDSVCNFVVKTRVCQLKEFMITLDKCNHFWAVTGHFFSWSVTTDKCMKILFGRQTVWYTTEAIDLRIPGLMRGMFSACVVYISLKYSGHKQIPLFGRLFSFMCRPDYQSASDT
jgi:hypothetical protein